MNWDETDRTARIRSLLSSLPAAAQPAQVAGRSRPCPWCGTTQAKLTPAPTFSGAWLYCRSCRRSADLFDVYLAGKKLKLRQGLEVLADGSDERELKKLKAAYAVTNRRVASALRAINLWSAAVGVRLIEWTAGWWNKNLNTHSFAHHPMGPSTLGRVLLLTDQAELRRAVGAAAKGLPWDRSVVLPFFRLPGLPAGFLILPAQSQGDFSPLYLRVRVGAHRDAGVANVEALTDPAKEETLAVESWFMYAKLQVRHLHEFGHLAPLVLYHDAGFGEDRRDPRERVETCWREAQGKPLTFWAPRRITTGCFRRLRETGARLSIFGSKHDDVPMLNKYLRRLGGLAFLSEMRRFSRPWEKAFRNWMYYAADEDVSRLYKRLTPSEQDYVREISGTSFRESLAPTIPAVAASVGVLRQYPDRLMLETPGKKPLLILNGKLSIERLVGENPQRASCRLEFAGRSHRLFLEEATDTVLRARLRELALSKKLPLDLPKRTEFSLLQALVRMWRPQHNRGRRRIGWDVDGGFFQFPHNVVKEGMLLPGNPIYVPRSDIGPPSRLSGVGHARLNAWRTNSPETRLAWAAFLGLLPAFVWRRDSGAPPWNLAGVGEAFFGHVGAICDVFHVFRERRLRRHDAPGDALWFDHDWPIAPCIEVGRKSALSWLLQDVLQGAVFYASEDEAAFLLQDPRFCALHATELTSARTLRSLPCDALVFAYLRWSTERPPLEKTADWKTTLLPDVLAFAEKWDLSREALLAGAAMLTPGGTPAGDCRLVELLVARGLTTMRDGDPPEYGADRQTIVRYGLTRKVPFAEQLVRGPVFSSLGLRAPDETPPGPPTESLAPLRPS